MQTRIRFSHTRFVAGAVALAMLLAVATFALRGANAEAFRVLGGKLGITEQSRVGKLIKRIAPSAKLSPVEKAAPFATLTVTSGADTGAGTLRNQIAAAVSGDTIVFSGVTTVTLTSAELLINKNLTINGGGGVTVTRSGATQFRIFNISSGTVSMNNLTVTNGNHPSQAGGIQNSGTLTMTACTISGNTSPQGAGIQNDNTITLNNCTVSGNTTSGEGGGLLSYGASVTLTNCTFSGNTASAKGAGLMSFGTSATLTGCTFSGNSGNRGLGVVFEGGSGSMTDCIFSGNNSTADSVVHLLAGTLSITRCTFNSNTPGNAGVPAIIKFADTASSATITNSTFSGNTSVATLQPSGVTVNLVNNTFSGNTTTSGNLYTGVGASVFLKTPFSPGAAHKLARILRIRSPRRGTT